MNLVDGSFIEAFSKIIQTHSKVCLYGRSSGWSVMIDEGHI